MFKLIGLDFCLFFPFIYYYYNFFSLLFYFTYFFYYFFVISSIIIYYNFIFFFAVENFSKYCIYFLSIIFTFLLSSTKYFCHIYFWCMGEKKLNEILREDFCFFYRLLIISFCCGIAGILCTISSFRRVPCHLQDPLKGAALVYSLIFYFFFCRKGNFLFLIK